MEWHATFGLMVMATCLLAWWSRETTTRKFAILLFCSWCTSNAAVNYLGYNHAADVVPEIDACIALVLGFIALGGRNYVGVVIFVLFLAESLVDVVAWSLHDEGARSYYIALNGIFAAQVIIIGVAGVAQGIRNRLARSGRRSSDFDERSPRYAPRMAPPPWQ